MKTITMREFNRHVKEYLLTVDDGYKDEVYLTPREFADNEIGAFMVYLKAKIKPTKKRTKK